MTIKDVAAYCGLSVSTVSRVLNNRPDVSAQARTKVLAAISELNFVPNNTARELAVPPASAIGVVVRGAENPFYTPIIHAIEESCERGGYTMVLHQISSRADEIIEAAALVRAKHLRGLIFLGGRFDYTREEGASIGAPFVCCTNNNDFGTLPKDMFSSVSIDDVEVGRRAAQALIAAGHRRIAIMVDSDCDRSISQLRLAGWRSALEDANIAVDEGLIIQTIDFTMEAAYRKTTELLAQRHDFTALFAVADTMALAAIKALSDRGYRVPDDVSVIAVDGIEMSRYFIPTLTTFAQPQEDLGTCTVETLLGVLEGSAKHNHIRLETILRPGNTLAAPKSARQALSHNTVMLAL